MRACDIAWELQEMVKRDSKKAARWAHAFADSIDRLNEATKRLEEMNYLLYEFLKEEGKK